MSISLCLAANTRGYPHGGGYERYGLAERAALFSWAEEPLPRNVTNRCLEADVAAEADLLLNLAYDLPSSVVRRWWRPRAAADDMDDALPADVMTFLARWQ